VSENYLKNTTKSARSNYPDEEKKEGKDNAAASKKKGECTTPSEILFLKKGKRRP
jgi:hypothetical protein